MFSFIPRIYKATILFRQAYRKHGFRILIITILGFVSGLLGGIGIGAIIPLFALVNPSGAPSELDAITSVVKQGFEFIGIEYSLASLLIVMGFLFLAKGIFIYIANYINSKETVDYEAQTRKEVFEETMRASWPYLMSQKVGYLTSVLNDDIHGSSSILTNLSAAILTGTSLIMYAAIAINISLNVTLLTFAIGIGLFFLSKPLFYKVRIASQKTSSTSKMVIHHVNQQIIGAKTVKAMSAEEDAIKKSNNFFDKLRNQQLIQFKYGILFSSFLEPIIFAVIIPLFLISYERPDFNIAAFVATIYLVQKMFNFMQTIQTKFNSINQNIPALHNLIAYQNTSRLHRDHAKGNEPFVFKSEIKFEDIYFKYDDRIEVLDGINFSIVKGQTMGLIGPSGSGKTTIVDLLLRFLQPTEGKITIDGKDIATLNLHQWRKSIGYVAQDMFLMNDTIENNIKFYEDYTHEDIIRAAKEANIYDFIESQPDKFHTAVGERGLQLSAGQRQRIALARVLLRRPEILILDEATSALDNESEAAIQKSIENLYGKITIFMIAHRLTTVNNSDQLIVLSGGKIIEQGSPKELMANKDSYFHRVYHSKNAF